LMRALTTPTPAVAAGAKPTTAPPVAAGYKPAQLREMNQLIESVRNK
ncbi:MAG: hypothetical protein JO010_10805, partial [Alphaproteobacteria bacterium]|nr:hypothetical protein [Alphaproteobacteria bacterium]